MCDEPVRPRTGHPRLLVLDLLELEKQLVGVPVLPAAELAPVVAQDRLDFSPRAPRKWAACGCSKRLKQSSTVLDVDLTHPLQRAREEGVHRHWFARSSTRVEARALSSACGRRGRTNARRLVELEADMVLSEPLRDEQVAVTKPKTVGA